MICNTRKLTRRSAYPIMHPPLKLNLPLIVENKLLSPNLIITNLMHGGYISRKIC